ncbi:AEC family transporter [Flavimobilis soli]
MLQGFTIIAVVILVGFVVGRIGLLGPAARPVIARLTFFVLAPSLLFTIMLEADVADLVSPLVGASVAAALGAFGLYSLVARLVWRRRVADTVVGALGAGYVNANNIGLPVAGYVLGDATLMAPVILVQLLVFSPVALTLLDASTSGVVTLRRVLAQPVRNPIIIASAAGLALSVLGVDLPDAAVEPFRIVGGGAVPLMLIAFGISLAGQRILEPGAQRRDAILASSIKLLVMPALALLVGTVLGLHGHDLFVVVTLAALPTAQNVFNYAQRYDAAEVLARDTIAVTTLGALPVLMVVAATLH